MSKILIETKQGKEASSIGLAIKSDTIVAVYVKTDTECDEYVIKVSTVIKGILISHEIWFNSEKEALSTYARLHQYV